MDCRSDSELKNHRGGVEKESPCKDKHNEKFNISERKRKKLRVMKLQINRGSKIIGVSEAKREEGKEKKEYIKKTRSKIKQVSEAKIKEGILKKNGKCIYKKQTNNGSKN